SGIARQYGNAELLRLGDVAAVVALLGPSQRFFAIRGRRPHLWPLCRLQVFCERGRQSAHRFCLATTEVRIQLERQQGRFGLTKARKRNKTASGANRMRSRPAVAPRQPFFEEAAYCS